MTAEHSDRPSTPEPERNYQGPQGFDLTTAGSSFKPKGAFWLTEQLNAGKPESEWVGLEVYATRDIPLLSPIGVAIKKLPKGITSEEIWDWQKEFPHTMVLRVNPAFSATKAEAIYRIGLGEKGNGLMHHLYQGAWLISFGAADNMLGVNLTADLRSQEKDQPILTAKANVIIHFAKKGMLAEVKRQTGGILAGNERRYKSPVVDDQRVIWDPRTIVSQVIEQFDEVEGLSLGLDHKPQKGAEIMDVLDDATVTDQIKVIHVANTAREIHGDIQVGDEQIAALIKKLSGIRFAHSVRVAFDYNPEIFSKKSPQQQLETIRELIDWWKTVQNGGDATPRILRFHRPAISTHRKTKRAVV